jgi:hypothetical protein
METKNSYPYVYWWGNTAERELWLGKRCRIIEKKDRQSCVIEFEDGGYLNTTIGSIRKANKVCP